MKKTLVILSSVMFGLCTPIVAKSISNVVETRAEQASTIYFEPNSVWKSGASRYAAYFFNGGDYIWKNLDSVGGNYYSVLVPTGYNSVVFCAMNSDVNGWNYVKYQTNDLYLSGYGDNLYSLFEGDKNTTKATGTWHTYGDSVIMGGGQENIYNSKYGTYYQLLVYSFADGNGDGIGDFKGIIDHLDYLTNLGIGGLYLSPIQKADSYHGYDITDYYSVNSDYVVTVKGVTYDLDKLLEECHNHKIKVILDMVLNHCSYNHPWVKSHPSWFTNDPAFEGMIDFNMYSSDVKNELKNIGKYWLENYDVDGYRLDAVKWFYNSGGMSSWDNYKNTEWLSEFYAACRTVKDDVYMIGEDYVGDDNEIAYYHRNNGIDSLFNFVIENPIDNGNASNYVNYIYDYQNKVRYYQSDAIEASFLSNHDRGRYGSYYSLDKYLFSHYLNIFAPGNSYVYYGDEINLQAEVRYKSGDSGYEDFLYRTPMPFSSGETDMETYLKGFSNPWRPFDSCTSVGYSNQKSDVDASKVNSAYSVLAEAIRTKNSVPVLYKGEISKNNISDTSIGSYISSDGFTSATVIFNSSSTPKMVQFSSSISIVGNVSFSGHSYLSDKVLTIAPYSVVIVDGSHSFSAYSGGGEITPSVTDIDLYFRGDVNSWGLGENYRFLPTGGAFAYKLENVYIPEGTEFKVCSSDWSVALGWDDKASYSGDFNDENFEQGHENGNIKTKVFSNIDLSHYDIFVTSDYKLAIWLHQTGYIRSEVKGWNTLEYVATCLIPWKEYVINDLYINAHEIIQLQVIEHDTSWKSDLMCTYVESNEGFPFVVQDNWGAKALVSGYYSVTIYTDDWSNYRYYFVGSTVTESEAAKNFAQDFNSSLGSTCKMDGSSSKTEVQDAWAVQEAVFNALTGNVKNYLMNATSEDSDTDIANFVLKYDYILTHRGLKWELKNFALRSVSYSSYFENNFESNSSMMIIVITISSCSVLLLSSILLFKRKRK